MPLHLAAPVAIGAPAKKPFVNPLKAAAAKAARKAWASAAAKARASAKPDAARAKRGIEAFSKAVENIRKSQGKGVQGLY